jgi:hypothetical protein
VCVRAFQDVSFDSENLGAGPPHTMIEESTIVGASISVVANRG